MGLTPEQRAFRRGGIGSSDIGAIAGLNPWKNRYDVYCDKRGLVEPEPDSLVIRIGNLVESLIADLYEEETGDKLERSGTLQHPDEHWMLATPDRIVKGKRRIVEIKWVGWRLAHHWTIDDEGVPPYVRTQADWLNQVTGFDETDVAALIGGEEFRIYRVRRHEALGARLRDIGREFWFENVVPGIAPPVDGSDNARAMLEAIFAKHRPPMKHSTPEIDEWIEKLTEAKEQVKSAKAAATLAENKIAEYIGELDGLESDLGRVYWKRSKGDKKRSFRFFPRGVGA